MAKLKAPFAKTKWHELLGQILTEWLTPVGVTVQTGLPVLAKAPEADIILLTRNARKSEKQKMRLADGIRDSLATFIILEFKYTQSFDEDAIEQTLAYRYHCKSKQNLKSNQIDAFVLSSKTPSREKLNYLGYKETDTAGVYVSHYPNTSKVKLLVLNELSNQPWNIPLKIFASRREEIQKAYSAIENRKLPGLSLELEWLFTGLWCILFGGRSKTMHSDLEELTPAFLTEEGKRWAQHLVSVMPAEDRLKGLPAEDRLKDLKIDELISGLSPAKIKELKRKLMDL